MKIQGNIKGAPLIITLIDSAVAAGFPSPAMDYMEEPIDIATFLVPNPLSTFYIDCEGDSMIDAGLLPGSKLIVDRSLTAKTGDMVLAYVSGGFTVKFIKFKMNKCLLIPANKKKGYMPIEITEEMEMMVWGVVTKIIIDTKSQRGCML